ncbi:MAG: CPBP family intramembrane metalloprotease [Euryarchaeota archaeon]|nr:CPBP family intramembrane metalloprotease [Euryarchaeota archaeon]MDE1837289.1 CPBP family intramembrane metalloprotease [Euryarchaeota archaeon]MDE1879959.1 CPBP family intramembrane metalloprotease [Euryarchaeota archaeon]MDE2045106.1 CPBP family intramembrane metalloprotease [Thermoplasmata archaeon]
MVAPAQAHAPPPVVPSLERYVLAVVVLMAGIYVQYLPQYPVLPSLYENELLHAATTYLPGLFAFVSLIGTAPLRNFARRLPRSAAEGARWYGVFGILSLVVVIFLIAVYTAVEPARFSKILERATGLEQTAATAPWFFIAISFPVGWVEETLFRGFVLGGALVLFGTKRWRVHAVWTSLLFTFSHLYYAQTYLEVTPVVYTQVFFTGLAFAYAYVRSGGNLLVVGLLHGSFDAIAFSKYLPAVGVNGAGALDYGLLGVCAVVALVLFVRERSSGSADMTYSSPVLVSVAASPGPGEQGSAGWGGAAAAPGPAEGVFRPELPSFGRAPPPQFSGPPSASVPVPQSAPSPSGPPPPPTPPPPASPRAAFLPPICRRCGAIVVGDVHGLPSRCPRCSEVLWVDSAPGAPPVPPVGPLLFPHLTPSAWPGFVAGAPTGQSLAARAGGGGTDPACEDLPSGAWPPPPPGPAGSGLAHAIYIPPRSP